MIGTAIKWIFQAVITTAVVNWLTEFLRRRLSKLG